MKLLRITTVPISLKLLLTGQPRYMQAAGWEVLLVSADGPERAIVMEQEGVPHEVIPFTRAITPWEDVRCLWQLWRLMRRWRPDIVHTHTPKAGLLGMLAARLAGVPVRIHTVAGLPFMTVAGPKRKLLIAMERLTYWGAQHVWPNSESMLAYMQGQGLCTAQKMDIIAGGSSNGIDLSVFSRDQVSEERLVAMQANFAYDAEAIWLVAIGRVVKDKGIAELLTAFRNLAADFPQLRLLLAGPVERERAEETLGDDLLKELENNPRIQHLHWVEDVAALLCLADIVVHASHREGFPNVPLQAAAMEVPLVCSAIPGNIDIVSHEKTGLTYPVGDAAALANSLRQVLADPAAAKARAVVLRAVVEKQFDRKVLHAALLERYKTLVESERQGKP